MSEYFVSLKLGLGLVWRVWHRYGNTCSDRVMGSTSIGTVLVFGTLQHTVYLYHGITGISQVYYNINSIVLTPFSHI